MVAKKGLFSRKKKVEDPEVLTAPKEKSILEPDVFEPTGPLCDCGNPVAPGQNAVCQEHIRST